MGEVGLILIFISLLQGVTSEGWSMKALPRRAISSSCVVIPCSFDFPSHSYTALHGAWFKYWYRWKYTITYTKDPNYGMATFVGRAKIIGDLEGKNCSVRIDSLRAEDSDVYYFYVDAEGYTDHTFTEPVQLQVLDVPDKPVIVLLKDLQEGTPAHIICKCLYTCPDNHPNLTWSELLTSSVSNITENGDEVSAVLTFNPSFKHHGRTLRCTCDYPQTSHRMVNSVNLSVKYSPRKTSVRMTLEKGKMISLSCSSDGNPAVHNFTWFKISQGKVTNLELAGQTITVPYGFDEEISYYCEATSILGSSQSLPIRIPTEYSPHNTSVRMTLEKGKMISLSCSSDGNPAVHNFTWFKTSRGKVTNLALAGQTITVPYGFDEEISYYCEATSILGSSQSLPIRIPTKYSAQNTSVRMTLAKEKTISLSCSSDGNPAVHNFTWFKISHGKVTDLALAGQTITVPYGFEEEISYYCEATSILGSSQSLPIRIPTEYSPRNTSIRMTLEKGKMISLSCSSDGNPAVHNFTWFKISQGKVTNLALAGQSITVPYGFDEEISYYCEATSILGSSQSLPIRIHTEYSPHNTSVRLTLEKGKMISLSCFSDGDPAVHNFTWFKITQGKMMNLALAGQTITVPYGFDEEISYYCEATSILGSSQSLPIRIPTEYSPHNTSVRMTLEKGKMISLSCFSDGNPEVHNFTWFKISQGKVTNLALAGQTITVPDGFEEENSYYCEATSILGSSQSLPIRIPTEYSPHNMSVRMTLEKGKMISLSCSSDGNPAVHNFTWFKISQGKVTNLALAVQTITVPYGFEEEISYYCEATSILGSSQSLPIRIPTEYSPRNTSIRMTLEKGKMISLSCSSDGNPTVHNFTWFKISQGKVTNLALAGQTITVPYGFDEEISYYCEATSILGSSQSLPIRIHTEYGAVILPESRCTQYLTNLTCLCLVRANSSVHITWALPGRTVRQTGSDGIYKTVSARVGPLVTNTLTISGSNMAFQTVNCSVVNDRGDRYLQRRLEIQAVGEQAGTRSGLMWKIGLGSVGGAVLLITTTIAIYLITKTYRRTDKRKMRRI
ncbi:B-cell receptor CD22-like isoform X4 [Carcharodon carcharias]|uniref:B-cell receptor CD22-like isoform X4 n=1 Tax=Carcharodon carcharias TaxID=13397 RepID=UPI001B7F3E16|nr:B-cell receptor CD22-like isoform X4 [Carcharodon carcharias]